MCDWRRLWQKAATRPACCPSRLSALPTFASIRSSSALKPLERPSEIIDPCCFDFGGLRVFEFLAEDVRRAKEFRQTGWFFASDQQFVDFFNFRIVVQSFLQKLHARVRCIPCFKQQAWKHTSRNRKYITIVDYNVDLKFISLL